MSIQREGRTGREFVTLDGHIGGVWCVTFSPAGKKLASASLDQTVKIHATAGETFNAWGPSEPEPIPAATHVFLTSFHTAKLAVSRKLNRILGASSNDRMMTQAACLLNSHTRSNLK